jgi:hypothetical protein
MDLSGAMPKSAWYEIRDEDGNLLESITAKIDGGTITATLPGFPAGTMGTVRLMTETGPMELDEPDLEELPTEESLALTQL